MNRTGCEPCLAVAAVLLLHWGLFKLLMSAGLGATASHADGVAFLRASFVEREPRLPPASPAGHEAPDSRASRRPRASRVLLDNGRPAPTHAAGGARPLSNEPLNLTLADRHTPDFSRRPLVGDTRLDRFAAPPERIPMRKPLTGKDVIEGAAQVLGLWPPGYTTDPCPRIRRNIDEFKTDGSADGRARLSDELSRQARYCAQ